MRGIDCPTQELGRAIDWLFSAQSLLWSHLWPVWAQCGYSLVWLNPNTAEEREQCLGVAAKGAAAGGHAGASTLQSCS